MRLEGARPQNAPAFTELREGVEIKHVDFSYVEGKPIFGKMFHLSAKRQDDCRCRTDRIRKTTIMNLINRFTMWIRAVSNLMDDIRDYDLDSLRSHVGIVLQDSVLFSGNHSRQY